MSGPLSRPPGDPSDQPTMPDPAARPAPSGETTDLRNLSPPYVAPLDAGRDRPRGRFTILRTHARGGLGQVHVARDEAPHTCARSWCPVCSPVHGACRGACRPGLQAG